VTSISKAIELDLKDATAFNDLGYAYMKLGRRQDAVVEFKRAIALEPTLVVARFNLGVLDVSLKNKDAALEQYAVLKTLDTEVANRLLNMIFRTSVVRAATLSLSQNK